MESAGLLKTGEVAKILHVHRNTVIDWAKRGILIPIQKTKGGYNFYSREQIEDFCKTVQYLLPQNSNGTKSSTIKNRTAKNLSIGTDKKEKVFATDNVSKNLISVNLNPTTTLTVTNDKLSKTLFAHSPENYLIILENGGEIKEKTLPKLGEIISPYWLELINEYTDKTPLNIFDKAVLTACTSEWIAGNKYTTPSIIYRHIVGKESGKNIEPSDNINKLILESIEKMMCTKLKIDMTSACVNIKYNNGKPLVLTATILPCKYVSGIVINGHELDTVIQFYDESPLLTIARAKNNQLLTFEQRLLDVPNQYSSEINISVRHYILQRILEIKLHSLAPIIKFEDVFKKCNLMKASSLKKSRTRRFVIDIMKTLKTGNDIKDFTVKKFGKEQISIEFSF